jgi:hypothetical protein
MRSYGAVMDTIRMPNPPPLPPVPVPMSWDYDSDEGEECERLHRLAVLHNACPRCADPPGHPTRRQWLAELAEPRPVDVSLLQPGDWLTPEGELASFVHGRLRVHDRDAFEVWARDNFAVVGTVFAHVAEVDAAPWVRGLFWFEEDGMLHLEAASLDRHLHLERVFEHLWPPVFRGSRVAGGLDDRLDEPYRPTWPQPPAEASAFTALRRLPTTATLTPP